MKNILVVIVFIITVVGICILPGGHDFSHTYRTEYVDDKYAGVVWVLEIDETTGIIDTCGTL
jgi:hypothetical protein